MLALRKDSGWRLCVDCFELTQSTRLFYSSAVLAQGGGTAWLGTLRSRHPAVDCQYLKGFAV
eukprot:837683-Amphidinium_carterae.1